MECLKKVLSVVCCKDCCDKRKESDSSMQIILPPTTRNASSMHGNVRKTTYTYLAQPDFYIPVTSDKVISTPPTSRRKQSAPPILTQTVTVQPLADYKPPDFMHSSLVEPRIHIEVESSQDDGNVNNNSTASGRESPWRSNESVSSLHPPLSPINRPKSNHKRLSVAQIAACHSRRSSMSSFDISTDEVDSEMYENVELSNDINSNGKLCFTVSYDSAFEQLVVNVICARNLWSPDKNVAITDSFVKVTILPPAKKKPTKTTTAVQRGSANPVYDETFMLDGIASASLEMYSLRLTIYAMDKTSKRKKLGVVSQQLDASIASHLGNDKRIWKNIYAEGMPQRDGERGNLMLTMCYQPTDSQLKINVVRGSQLIIRDQDNRQYEGVYVKIALISHGKVISKEKTRMIQPAINNPVFDEMFTFTLPSNMIDQSCVIVSVNGKTPHGKRVHTGYVSLGPPFFSTGSGLEQWTKMLSAPYTMIGKWHSLSVWSKKESNHNLNECNMF